MGNTLSRLEKERLKAIGELFIAECRSSDYSIDAIKNMLDAGLNITYKNAQGLYFAAKLLKFDLVDFLVDNGILSVPSARNYIASMCEHRKFADGDEPHYFALMDKVCAHHGKNISLFSAYINSAALHRKADKLTALKARYGFTDTEIARSIYVRIIFEIIQCGYDDILEYINTYYNWADTAAFDLAVATNEWMALEYLIINTNLRTPSETAVGQALYEGNFQALTILDKIGYNFLKKPLLLEKACSASRTRGTESIEFLFKKGYTASNKYKGKTVREHAVIDRNEALLEYISKN